MNVRWTADDPDAIIRWAFLGLPSGRVQAIMRGHQSVMGILASWTRRLRSGAGDTHSGGAGYDVQADIGSPSSEPSAADAFLPFAGKLAPQPEQAGYDVERDTGV